MRRAKILLAIFFLILLYLVETKEIVLYILVASMIVVGLLRKDKRKERNPYIIGNSSKVEYLTEEELKERLGNGKHGVVPEKLIF